VCDTRISKKLSKNAESLHHSNTCKIQTKNNNVALQTCNSRLNITPRGGINNDDKAAAAAGVHIAVAAGVDTAAAAKVDTAAVAGNGVQRHTAAAVAAAGVHTAAARPSACSYACSSCAS
jgi:hypothetical protein